MFDRLSEYLFYLLPGSLKKNKGNNQIHIFFKVIGGVFDSIRDDILRLREESMIFTASPCLLDAFARERDLFRLAGETEEVFRRRLMEKADIAAMAGSEAGILLALKTVGYPECTITPLWKTAPERWAEIYINFYPGSVDSVNTIDFVCIKREVQKTKQAGTLPNYRFYYTAKFAGTEKVGKCQTKNIYLLSFFDGTSFLNGAWLLDGKINLDSEWKQLNTVTAHRINMQEQEKFSQVKITVKNNLWTLDGSFLLDGGKKISAYVKEMSV